MTELPLYAANRDRTNNEDLRVQYLSNELSENIMKSQLVQRDKFTDKNREITNILNMFLTCSTEIIYRFDANVKQIIKIKKLTQKKIIMNKVKKKQFQAQKIKTLKRYRLQKTK